MRSDTLWMAIASVFVVWATFFGAMLLFFRPRRGSWPLRLLLVASATSGVVLILIELVHMRTVEIRGFVVGQSLMVASYGLFWWAVRAHGRGRPSAAFALDPPEQLVTHGPYAWIRHPFYSAYVLAAAGGAVFVSEWWAWGVPTALFFLYRLASWQEERVLLKGRFGQAFRAYCAVTGGFIPRLVSHRVSRPIE
jgi:protein-S-isoprenylcysteine O-methyltransferase Ste14